jgi:L-iditol 2-dehydrogenase
MTKMRAAVLFSPKDIRCVEVEKPCIMKSDDVLIKVKACGVCGSDIPRVMIKGAHKMPIVIGHEFSGEIVEIGKSVSSFKVSDKVTTIPLIPCGKCEFCQIGKHNLCENYLYYGSRIPGAMAEYIIVKEDNVLKLPSNLDYEMGAITDPVSVALHAVRKANIEPGRSAVVFGLGAIGLIALQWLSVLGCTQVIVIDIFDEKLNLAKKLGADLVINAKKDNVIEKIIEFTHGRGVDVVIELAGNKITQLQAIHVAAKMGKIVYCGISYDDLLLPSVAVNKILRGELHIIGSWNSLNTSIPNNEWETSLEFMSSKKIKIKPIISHRVRLEDCKKVFEMMYYKKETYNKVLFIPDL